VIKLIEQPNAYSTTKHTEHFETVSEKIKNKNVLEIECPNVLEIECPLSGTFCIQEKCAWFMMIQRACAINVLARVKY
jgi:hypothetical protein